MTHHVDHRTTSTFRRVLPTSPTVRDPTASPHHCRAVLPCTAIFFGDRSGLCRPTENRRPHRVVRRHLGVTHPDRRDVPAPRHLPVDRRDATPTSTSRCSGCRWFIVSTIADSRSARMSPIPLQPSCPQMILRIPSPSIRSRWHHFGPPHAIGSRPVRLPTRNVTMRHWHGSTRRSVPGMTISTLVGTVIGAVGGRNRRRTARRVDRLHPRRRWQPGGRRLPVHRDDQLAVPSHLSDVDSPARRWRHRTWPRCVVHPHPHRWRRHPDHANR